VTSEGDPKAEKLANVRVAAGRIIPVRNRERRAFSTAKYGYLAVWVEDSNGKNERCILLTPFELSRAEERARKNPEDCPKKGIITDLID